MSQISVLDKNNAPAGPFTRAEIAQKLERGEIALTDMAFMDGLDDWMPLQQVLAKVDGPGGAPKHGAAKRMPPLPRAAGTTTAQPVYAEFWLRLAAYVIDCVLLGVVIGIVISIYTLICGYAL